MTVTGSMEAQLAFLAKYADSFDRRVAKIENAVKAVERAESSHMVYTDEWLRNEMGKLRDRFSLPYPELLSQMNDFDRRMSRIEDTFETLVERMNRLERANRGLPPKT